MGAETKTAERAEPTRSAAAPEQERSAELSSAAFGAALVASAHPPPPGPLRTLALQRAQQTRGNHFVQGVVAQLQRDGAGAQHASSDAPDLGALPPGQPLAGDARTSMESSFQRDFSSVRIHTDSGAALAAEKLGASAFTTGRDIYFARGTYQPASDDGRRLLAHELVHTVQQPGVPAPASRIPVTSPDDGLEREAHEISGAALAGAAVRQPSPAPAIIARQAEKQPYSTSSAAHAPDFGIDAQAYALLHATEIVGYLGYDLSSAEIGIATPFVSWKAGSPRQFLIDFWAPFWARKNDLWSMLNAALAPDTPERAIDSGRDVWPWKIGPVEWQGAVLGELYKLFVKRIVESLGRIVPRWRAVKNQLELLVEGGDITANREPSTTEVFPSHPVDVWVIGALPGKLDIDYDGYRKAFPEAAVAREIRSGLRPVTFDFQMASGAWNWIRVTAPKDATPEEVAKTLYGDETKAFLLTPAPPLFGYPDIDQLLPVHQRRYNEQGLQSKTDPTPIPLMHEETPANQILAGPLADEAALLQAPTLKPGAAGAAAPAVLDRMRIIVRTLERIVKEYSSIGSFIFPSETFQPARDRADERSRKLASASPAEVAAWDAQSRGQLELVNAAESGLLMAREQSKAFKSWPSVEPVTRNIASHYARVAQNSDLVETGRALLSFADDQSRLFPVTLMDLLLAELRRALLAVHSEKTGAVSQETHELIYATPDLEYREQRLRTQLVKVRDLVLQHPEQAKAALQPLFDEIQDLQVEVTIVANMDQCDRAWRALYDSTSTVGEMRSGLGDVADAATLVSTGVSPSFEHGNAVLRHAMHDASRLDSEWNKIYQEYRYGNKQNAAKMLRDKSESEEWKGFMEHIRQVITDQATYDKWMTFALMVGIALLTAGIGTYVETAAGAAWGAWAGFAASTVTEAAAFTSMSYFLVTKDPSIGGFLSDFGKNVLTFGGLKIVSRLYRLGVGVEFAASLPGKAGEILTGFAAMNGAALYMADREMRAKTGHGLSWSQISEISIGNIGFVIAMAIGGKLAEPVFKDLKLSGELHGTLAKVENTRQQLMTLSEQVKTGGGKDPAITQRMLDKQGELVAAEDKALTRLEEIAADPKKASAAGLTPEQAKTLTAARGDLVNALARVRMARAIQRLEPVGPNEVVVEKGKAFDEVKDAFNLPPESTVGEVREDPVTHARSVEVRPQGEDPLVITERTGAKGEVAKPAEAVAEGEPPAAAPEAAPPGAAPKPVRVRPPRKGQVSPDNLTDVPGMYTLLQRMHRLAQIFNRSINFNELGFKDPQALADFVNRNPKTAMDELNKSVDRVEERYSQELGIDPRKAVDAPHKVIAPDIPPSETTGYTQAAATGVRVHADRAAARRAAGTFDLVNEPITDPAGGEIEVPVRLDLKTGAPVAEKGTQEARPDAVDFGREMILDDKPAGRPIADDRQEIIRFIEAYRIRTGKLPKTIEIHRYDPETGAPAGIEIYTPADFLPK